MSKKPKHKFLDKIKANKVFVDVDYINIVYEDFLIVSTNEDEWEDYDCLMISADRRLYYNDREVEGIIIGQCVKREGKYVPKKYVPDTEFTCEKTTPAHLENIKSISFWKIATKMNEILLVPKDSVINE